MSACPDTKNMSSYESFATKPAKQEPVQKPLAWAGWTVPYDWRAMRPPPVMHKGNITFGPPEHKKTPLLQRTDTQMPAGMSAYAKMSQGVWECIKDRGTKQNGASTTKQ